MSIDPLAEKYAYNSPYAFQENKMGMGRELEGLELVEFGVIPPEVMLGTSDIVKLSTEGASKMTDAQLKNFARGNATEAEQLSKNGLEKNTTPYKSIDPKTGNDGTTVPDAMKPDGGTVEIKDVKNQSLTEQLRLQKNISEGNGAKPELIINETAKLSKPLQKAGFDIKTYQLNVKTIDNTAVPKPQLPKPAPKPVIKYDPNMRSS